MNAKQYQTLYQQSIQDPENFWSEQAKKSISWFSPWQQVKSGDFSQLPVEWFVGGQLNVSYNCLDRHLEKNADRVALIWESNDGSDFKKITYKELHHEVCRFANVLKKQGIKKGDRVCLYLPMIPEAVVAMLACARIGAIHSVVFGGFSADSLKMRILDADCKMVITANEGLRGKKQISLKHNVDAALLQCPNVEKVIVIKRTDTVVAWDAKRDVWYHDVMQQVNGQCTPEIMNSNDPFFILYTSGSTGQPKGILHATGGYSVYVAMTFKYIFDYQENEIFWCTADIGWITGHSYSVYGPLLNGATTFIFEGIPDYPTISRYWEIIDKYQVNIFYTAPTAIRALRREGDGYVKKTSRKSLRLLGSVGEPINPEVWKWYYDVVGDGRCPIVDTWWQTETGGILISPLPEATPLKPGAASWPFFGVIAQVVDDKGQKLAVDQPGHLVIKAPWPGMMQTIYRNPTRFVDTYFKQIPGSYFTGDGARQDGDGYFWIIGREDDVIKVSGHRIGTGEIESALLNHPDISEAAAVAIADDMKGQSICVYVTTKAGVIPNDELKQELIQKVRDTIGAIATPKVIHWAPALPKTRSGKIMRRLLRKIASNQFEDLGDISTLADPEVVKSLIAEQENSKHQ